MVCYSAFGNNCCFYDCFWPDCQDRHRWHSSFCFLHEWDGFMELFRRLSEWRFRQFGRKCRPFPESVFPKTYSPYLHSLQSNDIFPYQSCCFCCFLPLLPVFFKNRHSTHVMDSCLTGAGFTGSYCRNGGWFVAVGFNGKIQGCFIFVTFPDAVVDVCDTIIYPASYVPEKLRMLYYLNPMASVVEFNRFAFFGVGR